MMYGGEARSYRVHLCAKLAFAFFFLSLFFISFLWGWGGGRGGGGSLIAWLSLFWFVFLLFVGGISERYFWQLAPFALFFTPNAINDFWPSSPMATGEGVPHFSYFTHIDIYLLMGVVAYCNFGRALSLKRFSLLFIMLLAVLVVFLGAIWAGTFWFVLQGSYQLRYFAFLILLFFFASPLIYEKKISASLKIVLFLIVFEALVFSLVKGGARLASGNYGVNSLGHLLAAGAVFFLLQMGPLSKRVVGSVFALILVGAVVATATRFSLVALFFAFSLVFFLKRGSFSSLILCLMILLCMFVFFVSLIPAGRSMWEGFLMLSGSFDDPSAISVTPESSSMITRLKLWWATIDMLVEHPWIGVGPGVWAFLKMDYGVDFDSVLDTHQDFLNYLVSYGLILGVVSYIGIFVYPVLILYKLRRCGVDFPWAWGGMLIVFLFAGATNAVTWKHQISALAYMSAFMVVVGGGRFAVRNG